MEVIKDQNKKIRKTHEQIIHKYRKMVLKCIKKYSNTGKIREIQIETTLISFLTYTSIHIHTDRSKIQICESTG